MWTHLSFLVHNDVILNQIGEDTDSFSASFVPGISGIGTKRNPTPIKIQSQAVQTVGRGLAYVCHESVQVLLPLLMDGQVVVPEKQVQHLVFNGGQSASSHRTPGSNSPS